MTSSCSACDYSNLSKWQMATRFSIIVKFSQYRTAVIDAYSAVLTKNEFTLYTFIIPTNPPNGHQAFIFCIFLDLDVPWATQMVFLSRRFLKNIFKKSHFSSSQFLLSYWMCWCNLTNSIWLVFSLGLAFETILPSVPVSCEGTWANF